MTAGGGEMYHPPGSCGACSGPPDTAALAAYADPFPLERFRGRWNIQADRDGLHMYSALRQPTATSIVYLVAHSAPELVALIERFEADA